MRSHHIAQVSKMMGPLAWVTITLAACATKPPEPVIKVVEVRTAVPVACVPKDLPPAPSYTDTREALAAAEDFAGRYQLLAANWALHAAREALTEAALDACRTAVPPLSTGP